MNPSPLTPMPLCSRCQEYHREETPCAPRSYARPLSARLREAIKEQREINADVEAFLEREEFAHWIQKVGKETVKEIVVLALKAALAGALKR